MQWKICFNNIYVFMAAYIGHAFSHALDSHRLAEDRLAHALGYRPIAKV